jgi:drug/metabolite transporter (DMT)-like permease
MQGLIKAHIALWIVQLMYGSNYLIAKGLMPNIIGPNGFILIRVVGAVALFWLILAFRYEKVALKDLGRLALCAIFGVALNQLMFFNGLMLTSPLNASVMMTTTPILVLLFTVIILKEKILGIQIAGVLIGAVASVVFILLNSSGGFASDTGDIFILVNASSYSFYLVLVKPLMAKYQPITVITWVFTFGLLYILIWYPTSTEVAEVNWPALTAYEIGQIVFVVIGVTFVTYLLNVYALTKVSPAVTAVYIYLQPVLATVFVLLFSALGIVDYTRDMSIGKFICAVLIFIGVYLVIKPGLDKRKEAIQEKNS